MSAVSIRSARVLDAGKLADILGAANARLEWLPRLYSSAEEIMLISDMIDAGWVQNAYVDDMPAGFIARRDTEILALAVRPQFEGTGVARILMQDAQRIAKNLGLWSYQANDRANGFYARAGFVETSRTEGAGNEANLPDIRYEWHRETV